jgi:hypothetical protein
MEWNEDLELAILKKAEQGPTVEGAAAASLTIAGFSAQENVYHVETLYNRGYIDAKPIPSNDGEGEEWVILGIGITPLGRERLKALQKNRD